MLDLLIQTILNMIILFISEFLNISDNLNGGYIDHIENSCQKTSPRVFWNVETSIKTQYKGLNASI